MKPGKRIMELSIIDGKIHFSEYLHKRSQLFGKQQNRKQVFLTGQQEQKNITNSWY